MTYKFQKRRGIGNVITTLIILIASVVLGAGVIFFGGSMFQSNTQSESVKVSNVHSWVDDTDAVTAFAIQNTGSKAVTINSINMRGLSVPTSLWYFNNTATASQVQTELTFGTTADFTFDVSAGASPLSLDQGEAAIVYLIGASNGTGPGQMRPLDAGNTYSLQIQAGQATAVQQVSVVSS
jgi:hypothetical protein